MRRIDLPQRSQAWRDFRRFRIGASEAASILNIDPYRSRLDLWNQKVYGLETPITPAMQKGIDLEPLALAWVNANIPTDAPYVPVVAQHTEWDWMIASLDGWNGVQLVEIKCNGSGNHALAMQGTVPKAHMAQMQHQLLVTGSSLAWYVSFDGQEGVTIPVHRDNLFLGRLYIDEWAFYQSIINLQPPEPTEEDFVSMTDPALQEKASRLERLKAKMSEDEAEFNALKAEICDKITHPRVRIAGLKITKVVRPGAIDYSKVEQLRGLDLEPFRKNPVESWRIAVDD